MFGVHSDLMRAPGLQPPLHHPCPPPCQRLPNHIPDHKHTHTLSVSVIGGHIAEGVHWGVSPHCSSVAPLSLGSWEKPNPSGHEQRQPTKAYFE
jgi:hypothetical protein